MSILFEGYQKSGKDKCLHGPHTIMPLHCTGEHHRSILHFTGERFGLTYGALKP